MLLNRTTKQLKDYRFILIILLIVNIGLNIVFFLDAYLENHVLRMRFLHDVSGFSAIVFILMVSVCFEAKNNLSSRSKMKYRKYFIVYIFVALLFWIIGLLQYKIILERAMLMSGFVSGLLFVQIYFLNRNIFIRYLDEEDEYQNLNYFKKQLSFEDYKRSPSWRLKIWFSPIVKPRNKKAKPSFESKWLFFILLFSSLNLNLFFKAVILISLIIFIEYIFKLYTCIEGVCTDIKEVKSSRGADKYYVTVSDFKKRREYKFFHGTTCPPCIVGSKMRIVIGLFSRGYVESIVTRYK